MTIANAGATGVNTATAALGTTSTTVAYTGVAAGRLAVITAGVKPSTATLPATLTDGASKTWAKITETTGGTGTNAADTGLSRIAKYVRILDGAETGSITVTGTGASATTAVMDTHSTTLGGWQTPLSVVASDATHGANCSAATGTWASALAVGDWIHAGYACDTDSTGVATSTHVITQTGTTFSARTARSRLNNSSGNQNGVHTWDASVTVAGGGTTATTLGFTWATSSCGPMGALRLREQTPAALPSPATVGDNFNDNTINTAFWDPWGGPQITESSSRMNLTTTTTAGGYYGISTLAPIDLNGAYIGNRLVSAGNQALASYGAYPISANFSTSNEAYWYISNNLLSCVTNVAGVFTTRAQMPYLPGTHNYLAVGLVSGVLRWVWSSDGTNWITEATLASPFGADTTVSPTMMVGTDAVEGSTTSLQVDDFTTWGISGGATANPATVAPPASAISAVASSASTVPASTVVPAPAAVTGSAIVSAAVASVTLAPPGAQVSGAVSAGIGAQPATVSPAKAAVSGTALTASTAGPATVAPAKASISGGAGAATATAVNTVAPPAAGIAAVGQSGSAPAPATVTPPPVTVSAVAKSSATAVAATVTPAAPTVTGPASTGSTVPAVGVAPPATSISGTAQTASTALAGPSTITPPASTVSGTATVGRTASVAAVGPPPAIVSGSPGAGSTPTVATVASVAAVGPHTIWTGTMTAPATVAPPVAATSGSVRTGATPTPVTVASPAVSVSGSAGGATAVSAGTVTGTGVVSGGAQSGARATPATVSAPTVVSGVPQISARVTSATVASPPPVVSGAPGTSVFAQLATVPATAGILAPTVLTSAAVPAATVSVIAWIPPVGAASNVVLFVLTEAGPTWVSTVEDSPTDHAVREATVGASTRDVAATYARSPE